MTKAEYRDLAAKAKAAGLSISGYLRKLLGGKK
jgi:hypothetical protein